MKPVDVKSSTFIESIEEVNYKDSKFKIGDIVRISNIKTFFQKVLLQSGLKTFL